MLPAKVKYSNFVTSAFKFLIKSITLRLTVWTLETESLGADHISATQLPDLGQVTYLFFNFLICKMGIISVYSVGKLTRIIWNNICKTPGIVPPIEHMLDKNKKNNNLEVPWSKTVSYLVCILSDLFDIAWFFFF